MKLMFVNISNKRDLYSRRAPFQAAATQSSNSQQHESRVSRTRFTKERSVWERNLLQKSPQEREWERATQTPQANIVMLAQRKGGKCDLRDGDYFMGIGKHFCYCFDGKFWMKLDGGSCFPFYCSANGKFCGNYDRECSICNGIVNILGREFTLCVLCCKHSCAYVLNEFNIHTLR